MRPRAALKGAYIIMIMFTVYTKHEEDLPEGPPHAGSDLGKCQL